jgi:small RNA 2'-O-methyltransferase
MDLGCGSGELLSRLAREARFSRIVGLDICLDALADASRLLFPRGPGEHPPVSLLHGSFTSPDPRLTGFDAAVLLETIEHVEPGRLSNVEHAVFRCYRPATIVITTPNYEYNPLYGLPPSAYRHPDHRFEWTRARFRRWCLGVTRRNDYDVEFGDIGDTDALLGSETQMAVFTRGNAGEPAAAAAGKAQMSDSSKVIPPMIRRS